MKEHSYLREELVFQLTKGNAHMPFEEAVVDFPENKMNEVFPNGQYTFWHLLEHIRRTQEDILEFVKNPDYKEKVWPKDYWPERDETATRQVWDRSVEGYLKDRKDFTKIINNSTTDLDRKIPWGTGQTILREVLVVADHTAYHIGEFSIMRQVLNAWGKNH